MSSHHYHSTHFMFDFDLYMYAQVQHSFGQNPLFWCRDVVNLTAMA